MSNNYQIYSGFVKDVDPNKYANMDADTWFNLWIHNTRKYSDAPINVYGPDKAPNETDIPFDQLLVHPNVGHIGDYLHGKKQGKLCGATAGFLYGMMHSYLNLVDFVYKEQDCLWFGDCVDEMYRQIGDGSIIFGRCKLMGYAQSIFLVKRDYIPDVIHSLTSQSDVEKLPEYKFADITGHKIFDFGYDRDRPFNIHDKRWSIQQVSTKDFDILNNNNLL